MKRKTYEAKNLQEAVPIVYSGAQTGTAPGSTFQFGGAAGAGGANPGNGTDYMSTVMARQQQMMHDLSQQMMQQTDNFAKTNMMNKIREEMEMFQQFAGIDLQMRTLPYKISRSFGQALGQVVIT
jgi:hypothetical protein